MKYSFFDAVDMDRLYSSEDWANYFKLFIGNGVYASPATGMQVYASSGMTVGISEGNCCINGRMGFADGSDTVTLAYGTSGYRYDAVCARLDLEERDIHIEVIQGTAVATLEAAERPEPVRTGLIYDIVLAYVEVASGTTSLTDAMIYDVRPDNELCGFVTGVVEQFYSTDFFKQYNTMIMELLAKLGDDDHITIDWTDSEGRDISTSLRAQMPYAISGIIVI